MSIASFFSRAPGGSTSKRPREDEQPGGSAAAARQPKSFCAWNANSLLGRISNNGAAVSEFLRTHAPDVIVISEVRMPAAGPPGCKKDDGKPRNRSQMSKGTPPQMREADVIASFIRAEGYRAYWSLSDSKYAGTGLLVRREIAQPSAIRYSLDRSAPPSAHHPDGRVIVAAFDELEVLGTYAPNNGSTEESFARRRQWDAAVGAFLHGADASRPVMWLGDLNVAAASEDVGPSPQWFREQNGQNAAHEDDRGQPGFTANEQRRFAELLEASGLTDAYRHLHPAADWKTDVTWRGTPGVNGVPEAGRYYNKGMRIDYVLVAAPLLPRLERAVVLGHGPDRHGFLGSDHCPLLVAFKDDESVAPLDPGVAAGSDAPIL